jgi:Multiubiquitin
MNTSNAGEAVRTNHGEGEPGTVTIIVNGQAKTVPRNTELTYDEVVNLAFPHAPTGPTIQYTVQYTRGHGDKPAGTLVEGQSVKVKDGMEFDVTPTNRS